jgi:hypothetical protein
MKSNTSIKEIRDTISFNNEFCKTQEELFQHITLRPILKYLNLHLNKLVLAQCIQFNSNFSELGVHQQHTFIKQQLSKNNTLKNQLIGCIIGLLDEVELQNYQQNIQDYNKRINSMIEQRVLDQYRNFLN